MSKKHTMATSARTLSRNSSILSDYLRKALGEADRGDFAKMTKIIHDAMNKNQRVEILQQWMEVFTEKLVEEQRNGSFLERSPAKGENGGMTSGGNGETGIIASNPAFAVTIINEIVLKKMPWFDLTSVHNKTLFGLFERYVLQMLSMSSTTPSSTSLLTAVYRLLLSRVFMKDLDHSNNASGDVANVAIKIANLTFSDRGSLINYVYGILNKPQYESRSVFENRVDVVGDDLAFLLELFKFHPRGEIKLHDAIGIKVGTVDQYDSKTKCFFIAKTNGKQEDISYLKSCDGCVAFHLQESGTGRFVQEDQMAFNNRVLSFVTRILKIYPLSCSFLPQIVSELFPYRAERQNYIIYSATIVLRLATQCPGIHKQLMKLLVEKILAIDCEVKCHMRNGRLILENDEMLQKLDGLLALLLDYFEFRLHVRTYDDVPSIFGRSDDSGSPQDFIHDFLEIFRTIIIIPEHVNCLHYICLYLTSCYNRYPREVETFLSILLNNIYNDSLIISLRKNSVRFLTSMLMVRDEIPVAITKQSIAYIFTRLSQDLKALDSAEDSLHSAHNALWISTLIQNLLLLVVKFAQNQESGGKKVGKKFAALLQQINEESKVNLLCVLPIEFIHQIRGSLISLQEVLNFPITLLNEAEAAISSNEDIRTRREKMEDTMPFERPLPPLTAKYFAERRIFHTELVVPTMPAFLEEAKTPLENSNSMLGAPHAKMMWNDEMHSACMRSATETDATEVKRVQVEKKKVGGVSLSPASSPMQTLPQNLDGFSSPIKKQKLE